MPVIPSEVEGSRSESFKLTSTGFFGSAQNDRPSYEMAR